jgi:hypothetical protein
MCLSVFFAQILGLFLSIVSLSILVRYQESKKIFHDFLSDPAMIACSGHSRVLAALIILVPHHLWVAQWPVIITIIGWLILLSGILRLFFPKKVASAMKQLMAKNGLLLAVWVCFLIGLYLVWMGFTE